MITAALPSSSLRHRMRLAAFGVTLLVTLMASGLHYAGPASSPFTHLLGDDFLPSYMAGTFVREGRADKLMDLAAARQFQAEVRKSQRLLQHGRTGPWLNPPFFAWLFVPLAAFPYRAALAIWFTFNLTLLITSIALLFRMLPANLRRRGDIPVIGLLALCSMPCLQAISCQQNTFLSLLILCGAVTCCRNNRPMLAGLIAGLLCFKPQLALLLWGTLFVLMGWRAIAGALLSSGVLILASLALMPGAWNDYLTQLPSVLPYLRLDRPYAWERQVTLLGFLRLWLQGRVGGPAIGSVQIAWLIGVGGIAVLILRPLWRSWRQGVNAVQRDRLLVATLTAAPLLMPYYMDYDLLLLIVPFTLVAGERLRGEKSMAWLIAGSALLYAWLCVNSSVAESTRISATVLLLIALTAAHVRRIFPQLQSREERIASTPFQLVPAT